MKQWIKVVVRAALRPISLAVVMGLLAGWLFTGPYRLQQVWRKPIGLNVKHIVHSSSGVTRQYSRTSDKITWFVGNQADSQYVEMQVPEGAYFWGQDYFSPDGKWYAINGSYKQKSESILFVFETGTGKMVSDIQLHRGSAELACFMATVDKLVYRDGTGLNCWDFRKNQLHSSIKLDPLFVVQHLASSVDGQRLYGYGQLLKNMHSVEQLHEMRLCCWSIDEGRQMFSNATNEYANHFLWDLKLDDTGKVLIGVFEQEGGKFEHHRDNNLIVCWDAQDGHLLRTCFKAGGEAGDPVYPLDFDHFMVLLDAKPPALRQFWRKWIKDEPGWLKSWLPFRCGIEVRSMLTGATEQRFWMLSGHMPRSQSCQGRFLETYGKVNGVEEIAYWRIEDRSRLLDAIQIGLLVMAGTWIVLKVMERLRITWRNRRGYQSMTQSRSNI